MMDRDQLITHVRIAAAHEVGLTLAHFEGAGESPSRDRTGPPAAATHTALVQLVASYCDGVIRNDAETWASTWTDDATWELRPGASVDGREAILAMWTKAMKSFSWVVQSPGACVFEVDEVAGTGSGRVTIHERLKPAKGDAVSHIAVYHDEYRRVGGAWRFASRRLQMID
jgi:limonene-1,2-epoxide hydrolase